MECLPDFKFHLIFQVVMHWIWNHVLPKFWLKWLVSWEFCQDHYVEPKKLYCRIVSWSRYYRKSILVDGFTDLENMKLNGKNNPVYSGKMFQTTNQNMLKTATGTQRSLFFWDVQLPVWSSLGGPGPWLKMLQRFMIWLYVTCELCSKPKMSFPWKTSWLKTGFD